MTKMTRRSVVAGGMAILAAGAAGQTAYTQTKQKLRFSSAFTETDLRAEAYKSVRRGNQRRFRFRALLGQHAVQAGYRAFDRTSA